MINCVKSFLYIQKDSSHVFIFINSKIRETNNKQNNKLRPVNIIFNISCIKLGTT